MDLTTAHELIELNNRFYTEHAASFSATRSAPWEGWNHAAELLTQLRWPRAHNGGASCHSPLVLDLACGNLRFERFLLNAFPDVDLRLCRPRERRLPDPRRGLLRDGCSRKLSR